MDQETQYREWLGERIEGMAGTLHGEGKGLWSLDTKSLEKLFTVLWHMDPRDAYQTELSRKVRK